MDCELARKDHSKQNVARFSNIIEPKPELIPQVELVDMQPKETMS
jgi:hypothetical protein